VSEKPKPVIVNTRMRNAELLTSDLWKAASKLVNDSVDIAIHMHPANVLAFSCEAANAMNECSQHVARLRRLQRRVRPAAIYDRYRPRTPGCFARPLRSRASRRRVALNLKNQS
jgi:hypothetical protein